MPKNLFPLDNTKKFTDQRHVGHNRWHPDVPANVSVKPGEVFRADCREWFDGGDGVSIYNGLWGFNSFDACLAIGGVFYVLSARSAVLAVGCAIATALLFGALAALFGPWGLPALTLPFCFGALAFTIMKSATGKLVAVEPADVTTPEGNLQRYREEQAARAQDIPPAGPQARPAT